MQQRTSIGVKTYRIINNVCAKIKYYIILNMCVVVSVCLRVCLCVCAGGREQNKAFRFLDVV